MLLVEIQIGTIFLAGNLAKYAKILNICTLFTLVILLLKNVCKMLQTFYRV